MSDHKERPILFSAPMVRAILEGRKMVTRRVPRPYRKHPIVNLADAEPTLGYSGRHNDPDSWGYEFLDDGAPASLSAWPELCPYGQPGDRLWVREAWAVQRFEPCLEHERDWQELISPTIRYLADGETRKIQGDRSTGIGVYRGAVEKGRPSIHMPRWASRITLEVTGVRVERLQDISEEQAISEGVEPWVIGEGWREYGLDPRDEAAGTPPMPTARESFRTLWQSINGAGSWPANPHVWVVEFKRVTP